MKRKTKVVKFNIQFSKRLTEYYKNKMLFLIIGKLMIGLNMLNNNLLCSGWEHLPKWVREKRILKNSSNLFFFFFLTPHLICYLLNLTKLIILLIYRRYLFLLNGYHRLISNKAIIKSSYCFRFTDNEKRNQHHNIHTTGYKTEKTIKYTETEH